ncbi:MAG: SpaA isopeptide-forming pilin-related protein [Acutalibacteraceae bacterium]
MKKNASGHMQAVGSELKGEDMTTFTWSGLDDGDYKLVETTTPSGYKYNSRYRVHHYGYSR